VKAKISVPLTILPFMKYKDCSEFTPKQAMVCMGQTRDQSHHEESNVHLEI